MILDAIAGNINLVVAALVALSVFLTCLAVSWPYLAPDILAMRVRRLADEREAIRVQQPSLRTEPKKLFKDIFERLNLAKQAEDGAMVQSLRMAGHRGRGPVVTFIAVRVVTPLLLFAIAAFYIFVVLDLPYPPQVKLGIVIGAALLGYYAPAIYVKNRIAKRQQSIRQAWPDALDLLLICVESGMGIESAFRKVAEEIGARSVDLAEELSLTTAELCYLPERRKAYENLAERTGIDDVKAGVTTLVHAEKYGTSVGQSLRVLAQESRDTRMSAAEKKAAALPPKLAVPMVVFFLPVLFAVIITPAVIQIANTR
jgi:tight adherence protein C